MPPTHDDDDIVPDPRSTDVTTDERDPFGLGVRTSERLTGDRYVLSERIGKGGQGEVMNAHDMQIGRDIAIKRMRAQAPSTRSIERFLREARIQGRLDHPAIVPVYELGRDVDGRPYFAMKRLSARRSRTCSRTRRRRPSGCCARSSTCVWPSSSRTRGAVGLMSGAFRTLRDGVIVGVGLSLAVAVPYLLELFDVISPTLQVGPGQLTILSPLIARRGRAAGDPDHLDHGVRAARDRDVERAAPGRARVAPSGADAGVAARAAGALQQLSAG